MTSQVHFCSVEIQAHICLYDVLANSFSCMQSGLDVSE